MTQGLLALAIGAISAPAIAQETQKKVLVIYSFRRDSGNDQDAAYRKALSERLQDRLDYYTEFIETSRFEDRKYQSALREYFRARYADIHFDVVIAASTAVLQFLTATRSVFGDSPIVFNAGENLRRPPNSTGIVAKMELGGTIELARRLQPGLKDVYVVSGASGADKFLEDSARADCATLGAPLSCHFLAGLPLRDLERQLHQLPREAAVFYLTVTVDGAGNNFLALDPLDRLTASSSAPVYSWTESMLGHGIVGGHVRSFPRIAERAAALAVRVLEGEPADSIPIERMNAFAPQVDWRQLERWGMTEARLPAGTVVSFRPRTFWAEYKNYVLVAVVAFLAETALVAGLFAQRRRRRRAEEALRVSEERYRDVIETQSEAICRCLPDTTITFVNEAFCHSWGQTREQLIGRRLADLLPEAGRDDVLLRMRSLAERPRTESEEHEVLRPDGAVGWQQWTSQALVDAAGRTVEIQCVGADVTERKRMIEALQSREAELSAAYDRVRDLGGRLIAAQEAERARIARDLHDDLSQRLALLTIDLDALANRGPVRDSAPLRTIARRLGDIASDVHNLSYQLHPSGLEVLGLVGAMRSFCRDMSSQHDLQVEFTPGDVPRDIPPDVALCLFRILQEALQNVAKHSGAQRAWVELTGTEGFLDLLIADRGAGFDASVDDRRGLGLVGMRERANFAGGRLLIDATPGLGTRLSVRIPMMRGAHVEPDSSRVVA